MSVVWWYVRALLLIGFSFSFPVAVIGPVIVLSPHVPIWGWWAILGVLVFAGMETIRRITT